MSVLASLGIRKTEPPTKIVKERYNQGQVLQKTQFANNVYWLMKGGRSFSGKRFLFGGNGHFNIKVSLTMFSYLCHCRTQNTEACVSESRTVAIV